MRSGLCAEKVFAGPWWSGRRYYPSGGFKKLSSWVNPRFMSMELFHRNMSFTLYHADMMPLMSMGATSVERLDGSMHRVRVDITNESLIPTITVRARENNVVRTDLITVNGNVEIIAAGWVVDKNRPGPTQLIDQEELDRIMVRSGPPGRSSTSCEVAER